jgi:hypothetical protein
MFRILDGMLTGAYVDVAHRLKKGDAPREDVIVEAAGHFMHGRPDRQKYDYVANIRVDDKLYGLREFGEMPWGVRYVCAGNPYDDEGLVP